MGMISQSMTRNGAKQVVLVGDFFQLPPVVTERDSALLMKFYPGNLQLVLQVEVLDRLRFRASRPQDGRAPIRPRFHRQPEPRPRRRRVVPRLLQRALEELPRLPAEGHAGAVRQQPHRRFDQPRERRRARRTEGRVRGRRDRHGVKRRQDGAGEDRPVPRRPRDVAREQPSGGLRQRHAGHRHRRGPRTP